MRRFSLLLVHLAVIAALVIGSGAHLVVLQGVAWTTMLLEYSQKTSMTEAVEMTFDGEHPCNLCMKVQNAERPQNQPVDSVRPAPELKAILAPVLLATAPSFVLIEWAPWLKTLEPITQSPAVPPPRVG